MGAWERMRVFVCLLALILLSLGAAAGTADDPEIVDPEDDHAVTGVGSDPEGLVKSVDLIAGWVVGLSNGTLELRLQASQEIRGGSVEGNPTTEYEYRFHFSTDEAHTASATIMGNPPEVTPGGVATEAMRDEADPSILVLLVPAQDIGVAGGDVLTELYADSRVFVSSGDVATDRAPDEDFGRDAELAADAPDVTIIELEGDDVEAGLGPEDDNGTYQWTWNASEGRYSMGILIHADGACVDDALQPVPCYANVTVTAAGQVAYACEACEDVEVNRPFEAAAGTWNVTATKQGAGSFGFHIAPAAPNTTSPAPTASPTNTTSPTASPTEEGEEGPLPWLPLLVGLLWIGRRMQAKR